MMSQQSPAPCVDSDRLLERHDSLERHAGDMGKTGHSSHVHPSPEPTVKLLSMKSNWHQQR